MLKTIEDLKELVLWAKAQKLRAIKVESIQFEFSDLALIEENTELSTKKPVGFDSKTLAEAEQLNADDEEKLLFWSTR